MKIPKTNTFNHFKLMKTLILIFSFALFHNNETYGKKSETTLQDRVEVPDPIMLKKIQGTWFYKYTVPEYYYTTYQKIEIRGNDVIFYRARAKDGSWQEDGRFIVNESVKITSTSRSEYDGKKQTTVWTRISLSHPTNSNCNGPFFTIDPISKYGKLYLDQHGDTSCDNFIRGNPTSFKKVSNGYNYNPWK